jgi:DDB1- and CUL4-associated factor 7
MTRASAARHRLTRLCTVWNVGTQQAKTQLIAHDKVVYNFAFAVRGTDVIASVGASGRARLFNLRSLEHLTIVYESPGMTPLLRLRWNKPDGTSSPWSLWSRPNVIMLDIRVPSIPVPSIPVPSIPVATLDRKTPASPHNNVNAISWAPHAAVHVATAGVGCQALIWDISNVHNASRTWCSRTIRARRSETCNGPCPFHTGDFV